MYDAVSRQHFGRELMSINYKNSRKTSRLPEMSWGGLEIRHATIASSSSLVPAAAAQVSASHILATLTYHILLPCTPASAAAGITTQIFLMRIFDLCRNCSRIL
jgi:hypothetical protein